ncbi:glucosamine-6-phosphate deaminase [Enterococcus timonensis]|uniref:glucosamine-6-phosphate deaminase n=1 Tax=Enterococcus timonensis TaxID=1852364 RepID=UPI0008DA1D1E|nr:glucosamine-6-phosphate deaminase [Enterococcus timonensis]
MKILVVDNAQAGGQKAFQMIEEAMEHGAKVLGLATGSTPIALYQAMTESAVNFSEMTSVNLDEYVGLSGEDSQSYRHFMEEQLFSKKPFKETFVPNGKAENIKAECTRYDEVIAAHPVDVQILGIGRNGHIGFNEPDTSFASKTHQVQLTDSTIEANTRFFEKEEDVPTQAISMGIASIMAGKEIILMAYGKDKAEAIRATVQGPVTEDVPASVLQNHPHVTVILDADAASLLTQK